MMNAVQTMGFHDTMGPNSYSMSREVQCQPGDLLELLVENFGDFLRGLGFTGDKRFDDLVDAWDAILSDAEDRDLETVQLTPKDYWMTEQPVLQADEVFIPYEVFQIGDIVKVTRSNIGNLYTGYVGIVTGIDKIDAHGFPIVLNFASGPFGHPDANTHFSPDELELIFRPDAE